MVSTAPPNDDLPASLRSVSQQSHIRIAAPSSPFDASKLNRGMTRLSDAGFRINNTGATLRHSHAYLNGTDNERSDELSEAFNSNADILWLARGGYGLTRLSSIFHLPSNDTYPTVIGFSDATALLALLFQHRIPCIHGPLATTVGLEPDESFSHLMGLLLQRPTFIRQFSLDMLCGPQGTVSGRLFAGNLCVLTHLIGTPWMPDLSGAILCIEEVGERPYKIDRMLTQLLESQALANVAGVVVGSMLGCSEDAEPPSDNLNPLHIIRERLNPLGIPVLAGLPIGHDTPNYALPVGRRVELHTDNPQLVLPEGLF